MRKRNRRTPTAANPGAHRQILMDNYSTMPSYDDLKFGHVLYLFLEVTHKKYRETVEAIQATVPFPCKVTTDLINSIVKGYMNKCRNLSRQREKDRFLDFCSRPLSLVKMVREITPAASHDIQSDLQLGASVELETFEQCPECPSPEDDPSPTPVSGPNLRQGLLTSRELKIKERIEVVTRNWKRLKERHIARKGIQRDVIRRQEEEIKGKNATIARLKKELKTARASLAELQQLKDSHKHSKALNKQKCDGEKAENTATKNTLKLNIDMRAKKFSPWPERELQIDENSDKVS